MKNIIIVSALALNVSFIGATIVMGCGQPTSKTVADIGSGVAVALCILDHSSEPVSDIVKHCTGATEEFVTTTLSKHKLASVREANGRALGECSCKDAGK